MFFNIQEVQKHQPYYTYYVLVLLCIFGLKMQLIGYLDGCKWLAMAPLTRQACGRARAPGQG